MASPLNLTFDSTPSSDRIGQYKVLNSRNVSSLFGNAQFSPFPSNVDEKSGNVSKMRTPNDVHSDDIYDTSISSIVEYTSKYPAMKLSYADFAYLKDVGVYPNNRLIIARRFASGVGNDLTSLKSSPLSTLITWNKDGEDFISVTYGEEWVESEASFVNVLNDVGKDARGSSDQGTNLGNAASKAFNVLPLPGFMEGLQYSVMQKMGLTDFGVGNSPLGNPNLIRKAKRRGTVDPEQPGSGLEASFSIKMVVEYEQKFINGVDPTLVYLDIIQNALTFGTSDAVFQFSSSFASGSAGIIKDLISGDLAAISRALTTFVQSLLDAIKEVGAKLIEQLISPPTDDTLPSADNILNAIQSAFASTIGHVISKYKVKLIGIANALTGSPSTPWHVTIGNPKKPMFSSGDMLCTEVQMSLGKNLAFNDLPSYIKLEFTLSNARPLGAQEVFNRFNTGKGRSYARLSKSYVEQPDLGLTVSNAISATGSTTQRVTPSGNQTVVDPYIQSTSRSTDWMVSNNSNVKDPINVSESQRDENGNMTNPSRVNGSQLSPSNQSISTNPDSRITGI